MMNNNFEPPSPQEISKILEQFKELLLKFTKVFEIDMESISVSIPYLLDIILEVEKEKKRIAIFHNNLNISEVRESSLYCYYILKKRPIVVTNDEHKYSNKINELFCVYFLVCIISLDRKMRGLSNTGKFTHEYLMSLLYIFGNGDLSKDAFYLLAITLQNFGCGEGL